VRILQARVYIKNALILHGPDGSPSEEKEQSDPEA
jgi:hypothetical protein